MHRVPTWIIYVKSLVLPSKGVATILNVPDTVGYMTPDEFAYKIRYIKEHVKDIDKAIISVHCHDDLGMANANTLAAIQAGAVRWKAPLTVLANEPVMWALKKL